MVELNKTEKMVKEVQKDLDSMLGSTGIKASMRKKIVTKLRKYVRANSYDDKQKIETKEEIQSYRGTISIVSRILPMQSKLDQSRYCRTQL